MPIETIKCQECGSAEVTEFKPGSYVCGHCEAIFKHIDPSGSSPSCSCGAFAIGHCAQCHNPVCGVHSTMRGRLLCTACALQLSLRQADEGRARELARAERELAEAELVAAGRCTSCGNALSERDAWVVDGMWLLCNSCRLSALRTLPVEPGRPTPARIATIEQLSVAGTVSRVDADRLTMTAHVSDEAWRLLQPLASRHSDQSPTATD